MVRTGKCIEERMFEKSEKKNPSSLRRMGEGHACLRVDGKMIDSTTVLSVVICRGCARSSC